MQQSKITILLITTLLIISCRSPGIQGNVGSPILVSADIPDDGKSFEYTWKFVTLPESSQIDKESLMFHSDKQSIHFTPDAPGSYSLRVIVWQYNDKISAQVFNYDIIADSSEVKSITIDDSWLNRRIELPIDTTSAAIDDQLYDSTQANTRAALPIIENVVNKVTNAAKPMDSKSSDSLNMHIDSMYTIQIASKKTIKEAWKIVENLIADGYDAYIQKAYLYPGNKMWFRVRIGKYKSKAEAEIAAATISENRKQSVWIDFFREDD